MADAALWIMVVVLGGTLVVVVYWLKSVLGAATSIPPRVDAIEGVASAASRDLDALVNLITTDGRIRSVKDSALAYGAVLDVAIPDAEASP
jgi:hypothetical protein